MEVNHIYNYSTEIVRLGEGDHDLTTVNLPMQLQTKPKLKLNFGLHDIHEFT